MSKFALDTNVLIYLHDADTASIKREKATELVANGCVISSQVISEYLNVCHKKLKMTKHDALDALIAWLPYCELSVFERNIYDKALKLIHQYSFQMFDAIIIASSILSGCSILYSEDMQHGLIVDGKLTIVNPFFEK